MVEYWVTAGLYYLHEACDALKERFCIRLLVCIKSRVDEHEQLVDSCVCPFSNWWLDYFIAVMAQKDVSHVINRMEERDL